MIFIGGKMMRYDFTAYALDGELDLNRLASELGIPRKYRWEEPMILRPEDLGLLSTERSETRQVYLYYFGGIVFLNCPEDIMRNFFRKMGEISDGVKDYRNIASRDNYSLEISSGAKPLITNDYAVMPQYDSAFIDIICFVIAKSVALERIEEKVDQVLDEMESFIGLLGRGKLGIPDKRLARLASTILGFKYRSLSHVMVLDKPDVTWDNLEADRLYLTMANLFELSQRYSEIRHKSETLMDITGVFSSLSHARRAARLELAIIILIIIEIIIYVFEIIWKPG
jgi:uncharacterized Rmd1/YagE family protein